MKGLLSTLVPWPLFTKIGMNSIELETLLSSYNFFLKDLMQLFLKFHQMWIDGIGLSNFAPKYGQWKAGFGIESQHFGVNSRKRFMGSTGYL
jgi:hypothetical protein